MGEKLGAVGGIELDDLGREHHLTLDAAQGALALQALIDEPLVGRVLVDDDEAVLGLRHDIGLVQLGARRSQRIGVTVRRGVLGWRRPHVDRAGWARRIAERGLVVGKARTRPRGREVDSRYRAGSNRCESLGAPSRRAPGRPHGAAKPERRQGALARLGRRADAGLAQGFGDGADDERPHQAGLAKANLGLRRVHIHIDGARIDVEIERDRWMATCRQQIRIGAAHRAGEQLVAHRPPIHEEMDGAGARPRVGGQRGKAPDRGPRARARARRCSRGTRDREPRRGDA